MKLFTKIPKIRLRRNSIAMLMAFLVSIGVSSAQLSGSYTIDKNSSASSTNFVSFAAFRTALNTGISAPITVEVVAGSGPYTETVLFAAVTGASATNTITIDGNGETIQSSSLYVIGLNGTDYMTIDDLHINNTYTGSSYQKCIWMYNSADHINITNCELTMPNTYSTNAASAYIGIMISQSSAYSYGDPGEDIVIENNKMYSDDRKGPYSGIVIVNESSGSTVHKVDIKNNDIKHFYRYGIYANYVAQGNMIDNEIHNTGSAGHQSGNTNKYGIYLYSYNKGVGETELVGNNIHHLDSSNYTGSHYGIYYSMGYAAGKSVLIDKNIVDISSHDGGAYGIYTDGYQSTFTDSYIASNNKINIKPLTTSSNTYVYAYGLYNFGTYYNSNVKYVLIENNDVDVASNYYTFGIYTYMYYTSGINKPVYIRNNIVNAESDGYTYGLYTYTYLMSQPIYQYNNTVNCQGWQKGNFQYAYTTYGIYNSNFYSGSVSENNIVNITDKKNGNTVYGIYHQGGSVTYRNNNLWLDPNMAGTLYYGYYNGNRNSFAQWTASAGSSASSTNHDAMFVDVDLNILIPTNPNLVNAGNVLTDVPTDIYGNARSLTTPDIGAIEYYYDIEVVSVDINSSAECAGYDEDVKITLKNNNNFTLPFLSADIYKSGVLLGTAKTSNPVAAGASAVIDYNIEFYGSGSQTVEARLSTDENLTNNTASDIINVTPAPSGGKFAKNASSKGMHLKGDFDVTIVPNGLVYDVVPPVALGNSKYSTDWDVKIKTSYANGTPVAGGDAASWTAPSGSTDGKVSLMPTNAVIDSLLTIELTVFNVNSGCDTVIVRKVLIAPEGQPDFINPINNCNGDEVAFDNASTVSTGTLTYEWDFGDGETSVLTHPIHKYASSGTYNVKLTTTTHPWEYKNEITKQVVVKDVPSASFTRVNACEGTAIQLTNTSTGGTEYTWNFGDISKPDVYTKDATVSYAPGGYTVTLTVGGNGCEAKVSKPVYQFAMPSAAFTNNSGACNTDDFVFVNSSTIADGSVGFSWDFDDNGNISTDANPVYNFENAGNHQVSLTAVSEFGCENKVTKTISVKAGPDVNFTYDGTCSESATNFTNGTTFPGVWNATHRWDFGDGSAVDGNVNPSHNWNATGDLQVTLTVDLDNNCSGSLTKTVKVLPQPVAAFNVNASCVGDEVVFENNSTWEEGSVNFTWDFDGSVVAATDAVSPKGNAVASGSYDVTLTAKVSEGCSNSITKTLVVSETPTTCQIVATPDHVNGVNGYKFESSKDGSTAATEADVTYYWVIEDHGTQTGSSVNVDFQEEGDFTVQLTARNKTTGCECTSSMNHNNVGIEDELTLENNLILYPNPAKSEVTIAIEQESAKQATIEIVNSVGAVVMTIDSKELVDGKIIVDVNDLSSGLYLVRITSGHTISTKKLNIIE